MFGCAAVARVPVILPSTFKLKVPEPEFNSLKVLSEVVFTPN